MRYNLSPLLILRPSVKKTFLNDAGDLWPNFHGTKSLRSSDKLRFVRDCLRGDGNHFHLGDRLGRAGALSLSNRQAGSGVIRYSCEQ